MKNKKRLILIICLSVLALLAAVAISVPLIRNAVEDSRIRGYLSQDLGNVDNIVLISRCAEIDGKSNSVAGVSTPLLAAVAAIERASISATEEIWPFCNLEPSLLGKFLVE